MKKALSLLLALCMLMLLLPAVNLKSAQADGDILWVNADNFPDEALRADIINNARDYPWWDDFQTQVVGGTYYLTAAQIADFSSFSTFSEIDSFAGLEKLTSLEDLLAFNEAVSVDIRSITSLITFRNYLPGGGEPHTLQELLLPPSIESVSVSCDVLNMNLSECPNLKTLSVYDSPLGSMNLSACTTLESVSLNDCSLTSLTLGTQSHLTNLECANNELTSLDLSGCTALTSIDCTYNHLAELTLADGVSLSSFYGDGQTLAAQGVHLGTLDSEYWFDLDSLLSDYSHLNNVSFPAQDPMPRLNSAQVFFSEKPTACLYDYAVDDTHYLSVTVELTFPDDYSFDPSEAAGKQRLGYYEGEWSWFQKTLTTEEARLVVEYCDSFELIISSVPIAANEAVYADSMKKLCKLTVILEDLPEPQTAAIAFNIPERDALVAQTGNLPISVSGSPTISVSITVDQSVPVDVTVERGVVILNGNVNRLTLKQFYASYAPYNTNETSTAVTVNGNVNSLTWVGPTYEPDPLMFQYYGTYLGSLAVSGSITEGLETGSMAVAGTTGNTGVKLILPVQRITKTANDPALVLQSGGILQTGNVSAESITPSADDLLLQYRYYHASLYSTYDYHWLVSAKLNVNDEAVEVVLPADFPETDIHYGPNTSVVVYGNGFALRKDQDCFKKEKIVLTGAVKKLTVYAAPVELHGDAESVLIVDNSRSFNGSSDVLLDGAVETLRFEGRNAHTNLDTGSNGSVQDGQYQLSQKLLNGNGSVSTLVLDERTFGDVDADTPIMIDGKLVLMSKTENDEASAIMTGSEDLNSAAHLSNNQFAVMTISCGIAVLSQSESDLIAQAAGNYVALWSFNVTVTTYTTNASEQITGWNTTASLYSAVSFVVQTPHCLGKQYKIVRLHTEGGVTTASVVGVAGGSDGMATVTSDKFSTFVVVEGDPESPTFAAHSLSLDGQIGVNFYMDIPAGIDDTDSNMTFAITHGECTTEQLFVRNSVPGGASATPKNDAGQYRFTCYINSIQMAETITATFHYRVNGTEQTVTDEFRATDYFENFDFTKTYYADATKDANLKSLVKATKNYGYFVQHFLQPEKGWAFASDSKPGYAEIPTYYENVLKTVQNVRDDDANVTPFSKYNNHTYGFLNDTFEKITYSLVLDSATTIKVFFQLKDGVQTMPTVTLDGVPQRVSQQADGRWVVAIPNIMADRLGDEYAIVLGDQEDAIVTVSALSYVKSMLNEVETYADTNTDTWQNDRHNALPSAWTDAALAIYTYWFYANAFVN